MVGLPPLLGRFEALISLAIIGAMVYRIEQ